MTRQKKKALLALAQEVVALYGDRAAPPVEIQADPQVEGDSDPAHHRRLTVGSMYDGHRAVPLVRLQGRWLERAGFTAGGKVIVQVQKGRIVLLSSRSG